MAWWGKLSSVLTVSLGLLTGCGNNDHAEQFWQRYHQQLTLQLSSADIVRHPPANIDAFPERRARLLEIPETRESMLNVYALRECQITSLVAARNNQLGRVAPPSQQWLYERTLWQKLTACWATRIPDQLSDENKARLLELTLLKTAQLPAVSWNAIFDSSEWEKSFSRASEPLTELDETSMSRQLEAINYLTQMTHHQFDISWHQDSSTLENHLKTLQERPLTAEILRALLLATQRLTEANTLLTQQHTNQNVCLTPLDEQPLEHLARSAHRWLAAINGLIDAQSVVKPTAIEHYQTHWLSLQHAQAPWSQFQQASSQHEALRSRLPTC